MRSAERLFAERGVGNVSLAEVNTAAGQRNRSAILYHFGDKRALLDAIVMRHSEPIHRFWTRELDRLDLEGHPSLRTLVELLVHGIAAKLDDPDGGPDYLSISAQLVHDPVLPLTATSARKREAAVRIVTLVLARSPTPQRLYVARAERVLALLFGALSARARAEAAKRAYLPRDVEIHDLVDTLVAVLETRPSPSTQRALDAPAP